VTELGQAVAWFALFALVLGARLLDTGPGRRFLRARLRPLADWWIARQNAASDVDQEYDEVSLVVRRQQLTAHVARLRRILATDESMSATRQIGNRLAYRWLLHELDRTPAPAPWIAEDDTSSRWAPRSYSTPHREAEVLEIGWRRGH
jgi:hypothetical protein